MQNLLLFLKLCKKFLNFSIKDELLIIRTFILTAIARVVILVIPFKKLKKHLGILKNESSYHISEEEYKIASKISWVIGIVSKYTPWQSKCLVQALTAQHLLLNNKIESTLYLGVRREKYVLNESQINKNNNNYDDKESIIIAHAWIRCGNLYITGINGDSFAIVAKFKKGALKNKNE